MTARWISVSVLLIVIGTLLAAAWMFQWEYTYHRGSTGAVAPAYRINRWTGCVQEWKWPMRWQERYTQVTPPRGGFKVPEPGGWSACLGRSAP